MKRPATEGLLALTEKEKQTLRLIVRGHDAKSSARRLGLSVHTINERLRDARRKMAVSSSREAARRLLEAEGDGAGSPAPNLLGDAEIGEDRIGVRVDQGAAPIGGAGRVSRHPWIIIGVLIMTLALGLLALVLSPDAPSTPSQSPADAAVVRNTEVVDAAYRWLALIDQSRWEESYRASGASFRKVNTAQLWTKTSEEARVPLGAVISRSFLSQEDLPAPPYGYEVVKFRTTFANKAGATETVSLEREDGGWHVVGIIIE